ncbi:MAG: exodeoxyribonuclease V subunit beta [Acidobacteria bacterium]|nr:exodeoxyribonuclease V subunit beta [Acidobacteriota bacterium]
MKPFDLHLPELLEGKNLIQASAGTGKTYAIALLFLRQLLEVGRPVEKILAVTFTRAATAELKGRIRDFIRGAERCLQDGDGMNDDIDRVVKRAREMASTTVIRRRLELARLQFDEVPIFTIHGFCQRILRDHAFESRTLFHLELAPDQEQMVSEAVEDFYRERFYTLPPLVLEYLASSRMGVDDLRVKARAYLVQPDATLQMAAGRTDIPEIEAAAQAAEQAFRRLRALWPGFRDNDWPAILDGGTLNKGRYRAGQFRKLDEFFGRPDFGPDVPSELAAYTTSGVRERLRKNATAPHHAFFGAVEEFLQQLAPLRGRLADLKDNLLHELFVTVRQRLARKKRRLNIRTFDDLLHDLYDVLKSDDVYRRRLQRRLRDDFEAVLIDEFQDTDPVQYAIFEWLFGQETPLLFFIGDPKQAIYSFRGADVFAYLQAATSVQDERRYTMTVSYRAEPCLVAAVNRLFQGPAKPFVFDEISAGAVSPSPDSERMILREGSVRHAPLVLVVPGRSDDDDGNGGLAQSDARKLFARGLVAEIRRLLTPAAAARIGERPLGPADVAVLVRTHAEAQLVKGMLQQADIPAVLSRSHNVFRSAEAGDILTLAHAAADPTDEGLLRAALLTVIFGRSAAETDALAEDENQWEAWLDRFQRYHREWARHGFLPMFRRLAAENDLAVRLLGQPDGERRITNLFHLAELLQSEASACRLNITDTLGYLSVRVQDEAGGSEEYELRLERDDEAVQIITIHQSKGMEYAVVFCPFLWSRSSPQAGDVIRYHDTGWQPVIHIRPDETAVERFRREELSENVRLMYVAVTRARSRCYIYWGKIKQTEWSAPAFLLHGIAGDAEVWKKKSAAAVTADLAALADGRTIRLTELPVAMERPEPLPAGPIPLLRPAETFTREALGGWRVDSFSTLVSREIRPVVPDMPDRDQFAADIWPMDEPGPPPAGVFAFPRGVRAGTALHEIMEHIDFTQPDIPPVVAEYLTKHRLRHSGTQDWVPVVTTMVRNVLDVELPTDDGPLRLRDVPRRDRLPEMEFVFTLAGPGSDALSAVQGEDPRHWQPGPGYIRGFIDLVFQWQDRYYIVDWKSNHLGNDVSDYEPEALRRAMEFHNYPLQYRIYVEALRRHLRFRRPEFDYDRHFGGVYYLFMRGVDPTRGARYGIFQARPSVTEMDRFVTITLAGMVT